MVRIHQAIQAGQYPNASSIALEIEVSSKTIQRDLEFMRDRLNLPLAYDPQRNGYYYTERVEAFPTLQITEGELFALLVAEKALQQYRGTSFEKPLLSALRKMSQSLPDTISFNLSEWDQAISFRTSAEQVLDLKVFDQLTQATARHAQLEIVYRKPGRKDTETRVVDPYHLANINGEWFLFAYDHLRKDVRTFVPGRIHSARPTGKTFPAPKKFSLQKRLRDSFGVHSAEGEFEVIIRFDPDAADYIREKRWHASQVLRELKGGGVELQLKLSSLNEIKRWILTWEGKATVVQPAELADAVKAAARKIAGA
ncbi:MAG: WYL domain-containing protein [Verrucomicrobiota bacterium]